MRISIKFAIAAAAAAALAELVDRFSALPGVASASSAVMLRAE